MEVDTDLVFKEKDILDALEELRLSSVKSGLFTKREIYLSLWPDSDSSLKVKPYECPEDLGYIKDYKDCFSHIELILPFKQKVRKELDTIYGKDRFHLIDGKAYLELDWRRASKRKKSCNYYSFGIAGRSLCDNRGEQFQNAIQDVEIYKSERCSQICPREINNFCMDLTSILNKYSLPKKVKLKKFYN